METKIPPHGPEGSLGALYQKVRADRDYWSARGIQLYGLYIDREGRVVVGVDEPERVGDELRARYADDRLVVNFGLRQTPNTNG